MTIHNDGAVTVRVDGNDAKLVEGKPRSIEGDALTLTKLDGENVTLRIEIKARERVAELKHGGVALGVVA